uniref:Uncharacterized protein n=1 Tax=Anguilla anguilla TaxID=7936 RepID=A0A0E9PRQ0_ANGAN
MLSHVSVYSTFINPTSFVPSTLARNCSVSIATDTFLFCVPHPRECCGACDLIVVSGSSLWLPVVLEIMSGYFIF